MDRNRNHLQQRIERWLKTLLAITGSMAIVVGLSSGLYTFFILKPKLTTISDQLDRGLMAMEETALTLENHTQLFSTSLRSIQAGAAMTSLIPETLISLRGTLNQSAELLYASSATTRELEQGISGLVLPEEELTASAVFMRKTATQLRLLAKMTDQIRRASSRLNTQVSNFSNQTIQLGTALGPANRHLASLKSDIRVIRSTIKSLSVPTHLVLAGLGFGGIYILLGIALLAVSKLLGQTVRLVQLVPKGMPQEASRKNVA